MDFGLRKKLPVEGFTIQVHDITPWLALVIVDSEVIAWVTTKGEPELMLPKEWEHLHELLERAKGREAHEEGDAVFIRRAQEKMVAWQAMSGETRLRAAAALQVAASTQKRLRKNFVSRGTKQ